MVFRFALPSTSKDSNECELKAVVDIPSEFGASGLAMSALRGSLILQNSKGDFLLVDSSAESILSRPKTTFYSPGYLDGLVSISNLKIEESKLIQVLKSGSPKTKGSYAAVRADGPYKISVLEY